MEPSNGSWLDTPADPTTSVDGETRRAQPLYPDLESWVRQYFAPIIARKLDGKTLTWCPEWWRHAEVIARLRAIWEVWESARLEGSAAMSIWWRDHADPHLAVILNAENGPLSGCTNNQHQRILPELNTTPAPPGHWGLAV